MQVKARLQCWFASAKQRRFRGYCVPDHPSFDRPRLRLLDGMNRPTTNSTTMSTRMPIRRCYAGMVVRLAEGLSHKNLNPSTFKCNRLTGTRRTPSAPAPSYRVGSSPFIAICQPPCISEYT